MFKDFQCRSILVNGSWLTESAAFLVTSMRCWGMRRCPGTWRDWWHQSSWPRGWSGTWTWCRGWTWPAPCLPSAWWSAPGSRTKWSLEDPQKSSLTQSSFCLCLLAWNGYFIYQEIKTIVVKNKIEVESFWNVMSQVIEIFYACFKF